MGWTLSNNTIQVLNELNHVPRVWTTFLKWQESVGEHTNECIALVDQWEKEVKDLWWDPTRMKTLLKVHDICEILTWYIDPRYIHAGKKYWHEEWAIGLLMWNISDREAWYEYSLGESLDSQIAKMLDKLQFLTKMLALWYFNETKNAYQCYYKVYFEKFPFFKNHIEILISSTSWIPTTTEVPTQHPQHVPRD